MIKDRWLGLIVNFNEKVRQCGLFQHLKVNVVLILVQIANECI